MKYQDMKESLKKKAIALREIKIGLKESQRVFHFNTYDYQSKHAGKDVIDRQGISPEHRQLALNAWSDLYRCLEAERLARYDYRARHIAMSLFRGKTPIQIESNYTENKWNKDLWYDINKHLTGLHKDNPPLEYDKAA